MKRIIFFCTSVNIQDRTFLRVKKNLTSQLLRANSRYSIKNRDHWAAGSDFAKMFVWLLPWHWACIQNMWERMMRICGPKIHEVTHIGDGQISDDEIDCTRVC